MIVFVPNPTHPLLGSWLDVDTPPPVRPRAVRLIHHARARNLQAEGGLPLDAAQDQAAGATARMLGIPEPRVRALVGLPPLAASAAPPARPQSRHVGPRRARVRRA